MILRPTVVDGSIFRWKGNKGVAEASDLGPLFTFDRVYDDACDLGLTVVSPKTGKEVVFAINRKDEKDGEIRAWELVSVKPTGFELVIFND